MLTGAYSTTHMGRPTLFKAEFIRIAESMCRLGATDMEVADALSVNIATLYRWKAAKPAFCDAFKVGKEEADNRVERSLYARAIGYEHNETDIRVVGNEIVKTPIRKIYPPDTGAAAFWLKNRRPEQWREMRAVELTGANGGPVQTEATERPQLSRSEWLAAHGLSGEA